MKETMIIKSLEWIATLLFIIGAILNAKKHISGFYIWMAGNLFLGVFAYFYQHWGLLILSQVYQVIDIYAIKEWKRNK